MVTATVFRRNKSLLIIFCLSFIAFGCGLGPGREIRILYINNDGSTTQFLQKQFWDEREMDVRFIRPYGFSWTEVFFQTFNERDHTAFHIKEMYFRKENEILPVFRNKVIKGRNLWKGDRTAVSVYTYGFKLKKNMRSIFKEIKVGDRWEYDLYIRYTFDDEEEITAVYPYMIECYIRGHEEPIIW
jgi:hypothetical protein